MLSNYNMPAHKWCPIERGIAKVANYFVNFFFLNKISDSMDYLGVDYYKMNRFVWYPPLKRNKKKLLNEMGWQVCPEGIYYVLKYLDKFRKPILILENGLADESDEKRAKFIKDHLKYIYKAIIEGVNVRGYFHWSLIDNFEWHRGFEPKFGLYRVNRETFERIPRPSAKVYAEICRTNSLIFNE